MKRCNWSLNSKYFTCECEFSMTTVISSIYKTKIANTNYFFTFGFLICALIEHICCRKKKINSSHKNIIIVINNMF